MTHLLSSLWINAWLSVLSTSILLAGKEDLFDIENNLYCEFSCCKWDRVAYSLLSIYFDQITAPACFEDTRKKEHDTLSCVALYWVLPAAVLSHLITWFKRCSLQKCEFVLFLRISGHITITMFCPRAISHSTDLMLYFGQRQPMMLGIYPVYWLWSLQNLWMS